MSDSNCRFLTCIQISQEAGKAGKKYQFLWYSNLFKNFPVVIHTVQSFGVVNFYVLQC